ncbi:MAG: DNA alkylation repair protein [Clostridia bacterium]|nr:DNA alkylation repair protein [Clostridia bacterium]
MCHSVYRDVLKRLNDSADEKFVDFSSKIINGEKPLIGVKIPELRKIAKEIVRSKKVDEYLSECKFAYFEDTLIYGFLIATFPFDRFASFLDVYFKEVDSWGLVDSFVSSIVCAKKEGEKFFLFIKSRIDNSQGFELRFYIVSVLAFFISEDNLDFIFSFPNKYGGKGYYVDMSVAWLLSVVFVKFPEKTYDFLKSCEMDDWIFDKTLSKICDSFRVSDEDKSKIKQLRVERNGNNSKNYRRI